MMRGVITIRSESVSIDPPPDNGCPPSRRGSPAGHDCAGVFKSDRTCQPLDWVDDTVTSALAFIRRVIRPANRQKKFQQNKLPTLK
jgi:hypothetical protein